jgi:RNA polymerase sigma-70 factor, ECF subfamily
VVERSWPNAHEQIHTLTSQNLAAQSAEEAAEQREQRELIIQTLSPLPLRQRAAVYLVDVMGFNYKQAAEILSMPKGSVSSSLYRGRAALRTLICGDEK